MPIKSPFQRFNSPGYGASLSLHLFGLVNFTYCTLRWFLIPTPAMSMYGGEAQFLTNIGIILSLTTFLLGTLADLTQSQKLFRLKNVFSALAGPLETLISVFYWPVAIVKKDLIIPLEFQKYFPLSVDLAYHLSPALLLLTDILFFSPPWDFSPLSCTLLYSAFGLGYWRWIEHTHFYNKVYPYPFFDLMNVYQRLSVVIGAVGIVAVSYRLIKSLYFKLAPFKPESRLE